MNPVVILIVILVAIVIWLCLSKKFVWIGDKLYNMFSDTRDILSEEFDKEKENKK